MQVGLVGQDWLSLLVGPGATVSRTQNLLSGYVFLGH